MRFVLIACILFLGSYGLFALAKVLGGPTRSVATVDRVAALTNRTKPKPDPLITEAIPTDTVPHQHKATSEVHTADVINESPWVEVLLPAKMHQGPSVESAITGFQTVGTRLRVLDNEQGWFRVMDPQTKASGWVYWKYLGAIGPSEEMQIATKEAEMSSVASRKKQSAKDQRTEMPSVASRHKEKPNLERRSAPSSFAAKRYALATTRSEPNVARTPVRSQTEMASLLSRAFSGY